MESAISLAIDAIGGFIAPEWVPDHPGTYVHQLPYDQQILFKQRWMKKMERKYPHCVTQGPPSQEERSAPMVLPYVHTALHHYNSNNPGAEFDLVKHLTWNRVGFRDEIWVHVNFLARPREKRNFFGLRRDALPDTTVAQHFFAELHLQRGRIDTTVVDTCTKLEKPLDQFKKKCAFCKGNFGILHPINGELACRKASHKNEYYQIPIWRERPKKKLILEEDPASLQWLLDNTSLAV